MYFLDKRTIQFANISSNLMNVICAKIGISRLLYIHRLIITTEQALQIIIKMKLIKLNGRNCDLFLKFYFIDTSTYIFSFQ
jgi:hypothetical protein